MWSDRDIHCASCRTSSLMWVQSGTWKRYSAPDPVQGLLLQVKRDLSIDAATEFTRVSTRSGDRQASEPLPCSA